MAKSLKQDDFNMDAFMSGNRDSAKSQNSENAQVRTRDSAKVRNRTDVFKKQGIEIRSEYLKELKKKAAEEERTLREVLDEALQQYLARKTKGGA